MKIMQINKFWRVRGGSERYVFELSRMLEERGHEIIPFAMQDGDNEPSLYSSLFVSPVELADPYRLSLARRIGTASRILYSKEANSRISVLADLADPDIAHMHNIYHHLSPSILPPLVDRGVGTVMTIHDYKLVCPALRHYNSQGICERCKPLRYGSCIRYRCVKDSLAASILCAVEVFFHDLTRAYTDRIDRFISPSRFVAKKLLDRGIPQDKVEVIPNFVDTSRWQPNGDGGDYILFVGRLTEEKGILTLIRAVATLPHVKLKVVGSGMLNHQMRQLAIEVGADNVEFLGFRNEDEVRQLVQQSRFTCMPSEWFENAPMAALEAFACGKPVVGSRIGGIPEMVREGVTGLLAEPGSVEELSAAIERLWNDQELCREMGQEAREMAVREFSPEVHYAKINATYNQIKRK